MIFEREAEGVEMRIALAELLHVGDRDIPLPAKAEVQIANGDRRRAADAGGAMEIDGVVIGEQFVQSLDASEELGAKFRLLFEHGDAAKDDPAVLVMGFERRKIQHDGAHVLVGMDIEHGGDAQFPTDAFDIGDGARMRADKEAGKDLRVG